MVHDFSEKLARIIADKTNRSKSVSVYCYALELLFTTVLGYAAILLLSVLFLQFRYGIIFILLFSPLRAVVGGYHAKKYLICFLCTCGLYSGQIFLFLILRHAGLNLLSIYGILFLCCVYIMLRSPIQNAAQPLSEGRVWVNRIISRVLVITECITLISVSRISEDVFIFSVINCFATLEGGRNAGLLTNKGLCHFGSYPSE